MAFVIWNVCCLIATNRRGKVDWLASPVKASAPAGSYERLGEPSYGAVLRISSASVKMFPSIGSMGVGQFRAQDWPM
jgi:hypothetical protein